MDLRDLARCGMILTRAIGKTPPCEKILARSWQVLANHLPWKEWHLYTNKYSSPLQCWTTETVHAYNSRQSMLITTQYWFLY